MKFNEVLFSITNGLYVWIPFLGGAVGAIVKDVLHDNKLTMPKIADGILELGFVGGILIGAFAGYVIDGSFLTAAMGGYVGKSVIENLMPKTKKTNGN